MTNFSFSSLLGEVGDLLTALALSYLSLPIRLFLVRGINFFCCFLILLSLPSSSSMALIKLEHLYRSPYSKLLYVYWWGLYLCVRGDLFLLGRTLSIKDD